VLTVAEEKGLVGAKALDESDVAGDLCLVLDADGDPGGIVVGSPTHYTFSARFVGQAAHAGVQPEKGTSAVVMAARAISRMPQGRIDEETTANVGRIEGGTATNIVTPTVDISGECRSRDRVRVEEVRASMHDAMEEAAREVGGRVDITWVKEYDAVRFDEDDSLLELVREACEDAGVEPHCFMTGGGSDANILCSKGVPALALASGMRDVHTVDESVAVEDIERLLAVVMAVIRRAAE
jgi:tripeptide aminopeptidase